MPASIPSQHFESDFHHKGNPPRFRSIRKRSNVFQLAEQSAGAENEFIQGICYFYAIKNHLLFVTVKGFRKSEVQPFFTWLLSKFSRPGVVLSAALDKAVAGGDIGRVSNFRIKGSSGGSGVKLGIDREVRRRVGARTVAWSKAEEVVQAVLPQAAFEKLVSSLGEKNRLVADVQWSVAGPRDAKVKDALQDIVTELSNMEDGSVGISGADGKIREGSVILEMSRPFEVGVDKTILIDFDHATDVLATTFRRWIEDKKITLA